MVGICFPPKADLDHLTKPVFEKSPADDTTTDR
jgi:hypothetical protein